MRRITRVLLALVLAPAALLVLWLVVWGGVFLSGTLNGAYALPVDEPNRLFIVLPEERPGSLLFLAYGCVGGQRRVLQDNTWTVSFNRRGLACTTDAPFVIKGGLHGTEQYRDAGGTHMVVPFFEAAPRTALYDLTDLRLRGWCGTAATITVTVFVWGGERDEAYCETRKHTGLSAFAPALHVACPSGSPVPSSSLHT